LPCIDWRSSYAALASFTFMKIYIGCCERYPGLFGFVVIRAIVAATQLRLNNGSVAFRLNSTPCYCIRVDSVIWWIFLYLLIPFLLYSFEFTIASTIELCSCHRCPSSRQSTPKHETQDRKTSLCVRLLTVVLDHAVCFSKQRCDDNEVTAVEFGLARDLLEAF